MDEVFDIKTKKYIVGSFDILGAKKHMIDVNNPALFYVLYNGVKKRLDNDGVFNLYYKIFSDNIVLAVPLEDKLSEDDKTANIAAFITGMQYVTDISLSVSNVFIRGGISCGEFYGDETFVYGKALVDAYLLESESAIYPRIISTRDSLKAIGNKCFESKFIKDFDGLYYFDFLYDCGFNSPFEYRELNGINRNLKLNNLKFHILNNIKENGSNAKARQKMEWLISYYNDFCQRRNIDKTEWISDNDLEGYNN